LSDRAVITDILALADAVPAAAEILLSLAAMALLMLGVMVKRTSVELVNTLALVALAVAGVLVVSGEGEISGFGGAYIVDDFARFMKVVAIFGSAAALVLSHHFMKLERMACFEYPVLLLLATVGMLMMISANDLIALYMGLELQSLALYVVAAFDRDNARSSEAGLKYFVLGALSSGMLLFGMSLIYGTTGSTGFGAIAAASASGSSLGLIFGLVFFIAGLAFKVAAVPFHMWTPDVYEGSPTPVTAFFAAAPKVAAMAAFTRAMVQPFPSVATDWQQIVVFIALASMVLGAFAAIGQTNIKRLLAYSSIGHIGYALVGLAAGGPDGVRSVVIYLIIYMIMTLGTFACVIAMRRSEGPVEAIADLAGLARHDKTMAFVLAMLMFSLAGIPPLAGFFAKYFVFMAAIKAGLVALAVLGVIASVISAYYYLRIVKLVYFDEPVKEFIRAPGEVRLMILLAGIFVVGFVFFAQPIVVLAQEAATALF
jgi:NADH-quinone oxidoreductase subunit N